MARGKSQRQQMGHGAPMKHSEVASLNPIAQKVNEVLIAPSYKPVWISGEQVVRLEQMGAPYSMSAQEMLCIILLHAQDYPDEIHAYIKGILKEKP
jgi:hypothetical protein